MGTMPQCGLRRPDKLLAPEAQSAHKLPTRLPEEAYIYQIYAYLRSQAGTGNPLCDKAEGVLLHPAIDASVDETVHIQGHPIRFLTVDLAEPTPVVLGTLRSLVRLPQRALLGA
jgi:hypothetical protein